MCVCVWLIGLAFSDGSNCQLLQLRIGFVIRVLHDLVESGSEDLAGLGVKGIAMKIVRPA